MREMASVYFLEEMVTITLFSVLGFILYKFLTRNFDYWENRNVPYEKPFPFFGNYYEILTFRSSIAHYLAKLYNQFNAPYFGIFVLNRPTLVLKNPELIKSVLVKDFNYFCNRSVLSDETCDILFSKNLLNVNNPEWRSLRSKMTPMYTSGKLKGMFELMNTVSLNMNAYLQNNISKGSIEAKEICIKYATDVIATCAFGLEGNCFKNENSEFRLIGRKIFDFSLEGAFRQASYFMIPEVVKLVRFSVFKQGVAEFFRDVFWKTIHFREKTKFKRNDLIDILMKLKNEQDNFLDLTGDKLVAQAVIFFIAGSETTSATMAFALYELALAPEIQEKARKEVTEVILKHGNLTFEAIQDMKYLHMLICETLRKYPAAPFLMRICVEDYKMPGGDLVVEKGTQVFVSLLGLHYDPELHLEPEKYDPERFSVENKVNISSFSYLPFGEGPRNCIGERFALLASKLALARILSEYELEKSVDTPVPMEYEAKSLFLTARTGLAIKFKKIV